MLSFLFEVTIFSVSGLSYAKHEVTNPTESCYTYTTVDSQRIFSINYDQAKCSLSTNGGRKSTKVPLRSNEYICQYVYSLDNFDNFR